MNVSIIIPAFNAADTLEKTLESLRAQTIGNWEAIVVNDGSTDSTGDIAEAFESMDSRIRVIRQANGGMTVARNNAIENASFDWVCFLDSDDWLMPAYLEQMIGALKSDASLDAVHCGWLLVDPRGVKFDEYSNLEAGDLFPVLACRNIFPIHTCVVRRSFIQLVRGFDTSFKVSADWDIWQRVARTGAKFGAVPDILAVYCLRPSATWLNAEKFLSQGIGIIKQGHSHDPRVLSAAPAYHNGLPKDGLPRALYSFVCWPAAFALSRGEDARHLLNAFKGLKHQELEPDEVAKAVFYGALLPRCQTPAAWESLWPYLEQNVNLFLNELENRSGAVGLSYRSRVILEKMIGVKSLGKFRVRLRGVKKQIGRILGLPSVQFNLGSALRKMNPFNRVFDFKEVQRGDRNDPYARALILVYHRVNEIRPDSWDLCVSPKNFVEHLEVLKSHAHPVSLTELLESIDMRKIIDRSVVITFDDGYGDNFLQANPLLELHRIPATFFLTSNCIESSSEFWWDELDQILFQPRRLPQKLRLEISGTVREWDLGPAFDWNPDDEERHREWKYYKPLPTLRHEVFCEVKNLLKQLPDSHRRTAIETIREWAGHKTEVRSTHRTLSIGEIIKLSHRDLNEIGSHSVTHTNLSSLSLTAQREEILRSKSELEVLLKRPITHFAYPYGGKDTYSDDTVRLVQESGYRSACTTSEGVVYQDSDLFHLPRMMVLDWDRKTFARQLARWFKKIPE